MTVGRVMHLVVTRPREDAGPLTAQLEARGHRVTTEPLLTIRPRPHTPLPAEDFQAILVTSANAVRALAAHPDSERLKPCPVLTVGDASAEAARAAGFARVASAQGDAESLLVLVGKRLDPAAGPVLYVTGDTVSRDLKALMERRGFTVMRIILYDAEQADALSVALREALGSGGIDGVLLFSPRTARVWAGLVRKEGLTDALATIRHFCLSHSVRDALAEETGMATLRAGVARRPDMQAMMELIG